MASTMATVRSVLPASTRTTSKPPTDCRASAARQAAMFLSSFKVRRTSERQGTGKKHHLPGLADEAPRGEEGEGDVRGQPSQGDAGRPVSLLERGNAQGKDGDEASREQDEGTP